MSTAIADAPTLRNGRATDPIPGLPQVYRFKAYGAEGFDYAFMEADGFVEAPYVIRVAHGAFLELPGNYSKEFTRAIYDTGASPRNTYEQPRTYWLSISDYRKVVKFAQRWNARFDQQAFDMLCRAARGAAERGQEAA